MNCTELHPNQYFTWEGELYQCIEVTLNKTAMAKMKVKIRVKQPKSGVVKDLSLIGGDQVFETTVDKRTMQFLYDSGDMAVFMDSETYDQVEIPMERLEWEKKFLVPNLEITITFYEGEVLGIILPDKVDLVLVKSDPAVKGNTATAATKDAIAETGLLIKVPLFVEQDEKVTVSTIDGHYCGRAN